MTNKINRISAETIQDINDVKTWARDHEIRMDSGAKKMSTDISELQDRADVLQDNISRSIRLLMITSIFFLVVLFVVVVLSGAVHIIPMIKDIF